MESTMTRPSKLLSPEQKQFFDKNGYILIRNLVPQAHLDSYRRRFQEICEQKVNVPTMTVMKDVSLLREEFGQRSINKLQDFTDDSVLFGYCQLPQVVRIAQDLIGPETTMAMHTMLINKPPDPGTQSSRHPMHQDLYYFNFRPADRIVCAWTAMERVTRANGCLVVVPGSHKGQLLEHGYPKWEGGVNKLYHGIVDFDPEKRDRFHVEMEAGDTLFFHPLLIHGSGANRTDGFRKVCCVILEKAISTHYANGDKCDYIDIKGTNQEILALEIDDLVKKKFGGEVEIDFKDIWRIRSKPVSGARANL